MNAADRQDGLRLGVYLDQRYWRDDGRVWAERSFVVFVNHLADRFGRVVLLGRLDGGEPRRDYALAAGIDFIALPGYASGASALGVLRALPGSMRALWAELHALDVVWLLGPSVLSILFAVLARARGVAVVLGVRQDLPAYARARHPGRRLVHMAADAMDLAFRLVGRRAPVIVVGQDLARRHRASRSLLPITVSLISEREITGADPGRSYDGGELTLLSVSRLDPEKNPLLLADVLARLLEIDPRWRLVVCGQGSLEGELRERLARLGLTGRARLAGQVPLDRGLLALYRSSHALLHVSLTEGVPQVLFEAFASGLPVVATDVGGVRAAAEGAALLVPPGDPAAAAGALADIARDPRLRERLTRRGAEVVARNTIEAETARVAGCLAAAAGA